MAELGELLAAWPGAKAAKDAFDVTQPWSNGDVCIVAADRGFVWVGKVYRRDEWIVIENALNIRRWGTTKGIGELRAGPTRDTVTDDQGTVIVPMRAIIHITPCKPNSW